MTSGPAAKLSLSRLRKRAVAGDNRVRGIASIPSSAFAALRHLLPQAGEGIGAAIRWLAIVTSLCLSSAALAVQPDEVLKDAGLEARARALSTELRCLVCQNQSIDDSDAPLAKDLRVIVRERLTAGDSDQQIRDFLVARYGAFVMLRPPVTAQTILLWASPFLALGIGGLVVWRLRRRATEAALVPTTGLTDEELARIERLLDRNEVEQANVPPRVTKP